MKFRGGQQYRVVEMLRKAMHLVRACNIPGAGQQLGHPFL